MSDPEIPTLGTGYWRGQGEPPGPVGQSPDPRDATIRQVPIAGGPDDTLANFTPLDLEQQARVLVSTLLAHARPDDVDGGFTLQLNASGDGICVVYNVASGHEFRLSLLLGTDRDETYTPASPFAAASAWLGVYFLDSGAIGGAGPLVGSFTPGGLRDFGPLTAGGPLIPFLISSDTNTDAIWRGPCAVGLRIENGPTNKAIVGYFKGELRRSKGLTV